MKRTSINRRIAERAAPMELTRLRRLAEGAAMAAQEQGNARAVAYFHHEAAYWRRVHATTVRRALRARNAEVIRWR